MNQAKNRVVVAITLAEPGGATSFAFGFAKWLKSQGYDVTVLAGEGRWLFERCHEAGITARRIRFLKRSLNPWNDYRAYKEIKRELKAIAPQAIHLNSSKMGVLGGFAAHQAGIPNIVYRIGGWAFLEAVIPPISWLYRLAEKWTAQHKNIIVCVHEGDEKIARKAGIRPKQKLLTIPNGIDLARFDHDLQPRDHARHALQQDGCQFVFGTIAHFYPAKDLPRYLEACALVHEQKPNAQFVLIGDGAERYKIRRKRYELCLEDCVHLLGTMEQASTLLRGLDAFVLPSAKEGMPKALLEAMAAALPCIATDVGANKWMLEDGGGWIVPKQNPKALAEAMIYVMEHPNEAKSRGAHARYRVQKDFPLDRNYTENERALIEAIA
ncbi:MAG TPA: glycosyltransferase [Patescibacteria group bacterium]|nr:glycosyltransferase [Patescibacteria group bacterium]